jgi:hypothetical protein
VYRVIALLTAENERFESNSDGLKAPRPQKADTLI